MSSCGLGVFLKHPTPGKVKTRLARELGFERAALLYTRMVTELAERVLSRLTPPFHPVLFLDPDHSKDAYTDAFPFLRRFLSDARFQVEGDLGTRMEEALSRLLSSHEKALLIGSDCIELRLSHLEEATMALTKSDVVFGPAKDGGYYLVGCNKMIPALFRGVDWSTPKVLQQSLDHCRQENLSVFLLESLSDLDEARDLPETWRNSVS